MQSHHEYGPSAMIYDIHSFLNMSGHRLKYHLEKKNDDQILQMCDLSDTFF